MSDNASQTGTALNDPVSEMKALAESEHRFRSLVETLPDAVFVHTEGRIVFANPFCARMLAAKKPEQLIGQSIFEIVHADYLPRVRSRIRDCHKTGTASPPLEVILIACDGSWVDVEAVAIPISWNGLPSIEVVARDISKRKQAENEALNWQRRLELTQSTGLRIGLWDWDVAANTVIWSDETYCQLGYTRDTCLGQVSDLVTRIHPEDRPRVEDAIRKVLAGDGEYAEQYRVVRPDGTTCWIDARGAMVGTGSAHMIGIGLDITNLKETEKSLHDSEERYLLLLNSTAEAIYGLDLDGNCTFCNPACLHLLGHATSGSLLKKNMHALTHHTRADGTSYPEQECPVYATIHKGSESHVSDEVLWRADGTSFPAEYWSYPIYGAGNKVGAVVTFLDISDRKRSEQALRRSEEKYRGLFEHATYGVFQSEPDGALLEVNPALVTMLGYSSREELLGRNLNRDIYEDRGIREAILGGRGPDGRVDGVEVNWKRKDGRIIAVRMSGRAVSGENGLFSHFEVTAEDITERRSLEQQFRQSQKMEAVGLLAGGISHDFNNLLGIILGNAELLLDAAPAGVHERYVEQIKKATGRATQLTRQLLAFSRKQVLYPTVLNLNTVANDMGKILPRLIGEDVQIVMDLKADLGSTLADSGQIEQILMNLATNARDAMPGGSKLSIRTENAELSAADVARHPYVRPGQYVHLSVSDTGTGMSEEVRSRVFEPFFTTKPLGRGTGLGLAMVYGIVKQSGGYVSVDSAPAAGTTFDIYLPRVAEKAQPLAPKGEVRNDCPRGCETILLIEDEEPLRQVSLEFLESSGYTVLQAGRGDYAIAAAEQYKGSLPLIVSDVILPDTNGPSVVAKIQALHPEAKALYVSGYADIPAIRELVVRGSMLLQKPVSRRVLLRKVDELLHVDGVGKSA